jgi:hypothetical protein
MMDPHSYREWLNEMFRHYSESAPDVEPPADLYEDDDYQLPDPMPGGWEEDDPDVNPALDAEIPF